MQCGSLDGVPCGVTDPAGTTAAGRAQARQFPRVDHRHAAARRAAVGQRQHAVRAQHGQRPRGLRAGAADLVPVRRTEQSQDPGRAAGPVGEQLTAPVVRDPVQDPVEQFGADRVGRGLPQFRQPARVDREDRVDAGAGAGE